jgi:hypothetical protein
MRRMRTPWPSAEQAFESFEGVRKVEMEDVRFFYQQANRCYQLAWQSFDLRVAQRLNVLGNEHTAKARELRSQETAERHKKKLVDPISTNR